MFPQVIAPIALGIGDDGDDDGHVVVAPLLVGEFDQFLAGLFRLVLGDELVQVDIFHEVGEPVRTK